MPSSHLWREEFSAGLEGVGDGGGFRGPSLVHYPKEEEKEEGRKRREEGRKGGKGGRKKQREADRLATGRKGGWRKKGREGEERKE